VLVAEKLRERYSDSGIIARSRERASIANEQYQERYSRAQRAEHGFVLKSRRRNGAQSPGDCGKADGDRDRAFPVERLGLFIAAFAGKEDRKSGRGNRQRNIQQEDRTPRHLVDQPAAEHGTSRRRQRADTRPGPDRMAALMVVKSGTKHREAGRYQQCGAQSLNRAADNEHRDVGRESAGNGGRGKYCMPTRKIRLRP